LDIFLFITVIIFLPENGICIDEQHKNE